MAMEAARAMIVDGVIIFDILRLLFSLLLLLLFVLGVCVEKMNNIFVEYGYMMAGWTPVQGNSPVCCLTESCAVSPKKIMNLN